MLGREAIINQALARIGAKAPIRDLDSEQTEAKTARIFYKQTRQNLLRMHPWNFALKRTFLEPLKERLQRLNYIQEAVVAPSYQNPFIGVPPQYLQPQIVRQLGPFNYQLPQDCLRVIQFNDNRDEWSVEGRRLVSRAPLAFIIYVMDVVDTTLWDANFTDCFIKLLSANMAYFYTNNAQATALLQSDFETSVALAKRYDAQEGAPFDPFDHELLLERYR